MSLTKVHLVPIFEDNYVFILSFEGSKNVIAIDPGDAQKVDEFLKDHQFNLSEIWLTHHHWDHVDGVEELRSLYGCKVIGSSYDQHRLPELNRVVSEGDKVIAIDGSEAEVLFLPGHTLGHIAYWFADLRILFSGDTLFGMGCGRLFEGTPEQMLNSLNKLKTLPADTTVYCTHEYTRTNGRFSESLEPSNKALQERIQKITEDTISRTVPLTLSEELETNLFLRSDAEELRKTLSIANGSDLEIFTELRSRRNTHR